MKEIKLSQGKVAFIDDDDLIRISSFKWSAHKVYNSEYLFYAVTGIWICDKKIQISMHRFIMNLKNKDGKIVDHINKNGLDNRKENLRIVSPSINACNAKLKSNNTSGYHGVDFHKKTQSWRVRVKINGKIVSGKYYKNIIDAAMAYDVISIKYRGSNALLNFPNVIKEEK